MKTNSLADTAYLLLRERMVSGELMPGTLLSENELAEEFQMSRTPVRHAIARLESEGYIVALKNRGVLVKEVSVIEFLDLNEQIQSMLFYCFQAMKDEKRDINVNLESLSAHVELQRVAEQNNDYASYIEHHFLFMREILASLGNGVMLSTFDSFKDKLCMYAIVRFKLTPHIKHYSAIGINRETLKALSNQDYDSAQEVVLSLTRLSRERILTTGHF
ncbi:MULTISPECIES: GntR family transcriptional regulator [Paenibacillus]|uniref:GntR family transcriptional regulator n=1 Tax=Paenibacillus pabuli TaxID=1472 RepID=A0A855XM56_9BACL|nr:MULTISPECIES: GntR family transcriptional regulator [Paenibacillus]PWW34378.1 GntR family transcriptional regulator [Paenibacillus pabuli]PXW00799.1 GntR family transcriptional regulator [Paenibacillus taichungensis]RAI98253.1 GntR family transcriptional regulator [Paenibacillus pabuli]